VNFPSIDYIFDENERIRSKLKDLLANISNEQASETREGEKWTIAQIVEHIAITNEGMSKVCGKLIKGSRDAGLLSSGSVFVSDDFIKSSVDALSVKVEAPERVQPAGDSSIAESLARMDANRILLNEIRPLLEEFDGNTEKFPHPFFGEMTAVEWLVMIGSHEARHTRQIERLLNS
jgi:hypothetical protein